MSLKLVLLDRDGVINRQIKGGYVNALEDFVVNLGVYDLLKFLDSVKIRTAIVTNQQGLGKGETNFLDFFLIQGTFAQECVRRGIMPPQLFYCPHIEGTCECRKPKLGLLLAAMSTFGVSPDECLLIGDSVSDTASAIQLQMPSLHFIAGNACDSTCPALSHPRDFIEMTKKLHDLIL